MRQTIIGSVISGGQTGADQAFLRAAKTCRILTAGWMPRGYLTEDGPAPELARRFCLEEHSSDKYPPRTAKNIHESDVTLLIAPYRFGPGSKLTMTMCASMKKPCYHIASDSLQSYNPADARFYNVVNWLKVQRRARGHALVVNGAGSRESSQPGIGVAAERFLIALFEYLDTKS